MANESYTIFEIQIGIQESKVNGQKNEIKEIV